MRLYKFPILNRRYYEGPCTRKIYQRSWGIAFKCWWEWDVLPWFKKMDYKANMPDKPYYRWEKYIGKHSVSFKAYHNGKLKRFYFYKNG